MNPDSKAPGPEGAGAPAPDALAGYVERVTYRNDDSGFSVIKVHARGHRGEVAVIGTVADVNPGEWIEAKGEWQVDPRHGRQFRAAEIRLTEPDSLEGIEKYLGSGLIHGIGPVYAKKLVERFGRDVFDVIEKRSAQLMEVGGIGPTRRDRIRTAWAEQRAVRDIMAFLFSHGVSPARAHRIYKKYGDRAIQTVRMDPYCLARDIHGVGFLSADRIAERLGIARDSALRARAGVEYTLGELTGEGHCAYPRDALIARTAEILGVGEALVETALAEGIADKRLVERAGPEAVPLIYLAPLDLAERELARRLRWLAGGGHPLGGVDPDRAVAWVESRIRLQLAPAQREALRAAMTAKVLVITGGPGVGKTTLVQAIVKVFRARKLRVTLCAPTGRAAKRLAESTGTEAKTIHRLLAYDPASNGFRHTAERPLDTDAVVVDESSMLDVTLACQLVRAVPRRAALILVGDVDQLPSVGPGMVLRDVIESGAIPVQRLTQVFRQAARSHIVENAHRINEGQMPHIPEVGRDEKTDFYFVEAAEPPQVLDALVRMVRERIPKRFGLDRMDAIQVLTPMQRGELGARNLNTVLQAALNPDGPSVEKYGTVFRTGDKVMQIENNYDKDVFNGDIGRILEVRDVERELRVRFDDRTVVYTFPELDELVLSYAITIHKSQGSEYPCVVIPIHTQHYVMLQRNLLYTAVTRGRKLVVLIGSPRAVGIAVNRAGAGRRVTLLRERLAGTVEADEASGL